MGHPETDSEAARLTDRLRAGDPAAVDELFHRHRDRLRRMVDMRLDRRLQGRIDASDVIQEAHLEVAGRAAEYLEGPEAAAVPVAAAGRRRAAGQAAPDAPRGPDARRRPGGVAVPRGPAGGQLGGAWRPTCSASTPRRPRRPSGPSGCIRLQEAINALDPIDREILSLRHFEELTRAEAAQALGIEEAAAAKRYVRALKRLKDLLGDE